MNLKKALLADFYMYEYLVQGETTYDNELEEEIIYQANAFLDNLKDYLVTVMEYTIIREISHVWWETIDPNTFSPPTHKYLSSVINSDIFFLLNDLSPVWINTIPVDPYQGTILRNCSRLKQYMYIKNNKYITPSEFIRKFKKYFTKLAWMNDYGDEKWISITNMYLKLKETNGKELFTVCDSIFWLQHNTNSIFNKINAWEHDGSYDWINKFLDFRKECDLWELWDYSLDSKKLAGKKLKMVFNETKEDKMIKLPELVELNLDPASISIDKIEGLNSSIDIIPIQIKEIGENVTNKIDSLKDSIDSLPKEFEVYKKEFNASINNFQENTNLYITDITKSFTTLKDIINEANKEFNTSINKLEEKTNSNMTDITKSFTTMKNIINETKDETIKEVQGFIRENKDQVVKKIYDIEVKFMDEIRRQIEKNTNTIIEKLERRWYKSLWKFVTGMFTK